MYVPGAGGDLGSNNPWSFTCWICLLSFHMWEHQKALINCFSGWTWPWGEWANLSSKWGSVADWLWGGFQVVYRWVQKENCANLGLFLLIIIFFQNKKNFTYVYMVVIKSTTNIKLYIINNENVLSSTILFNPNKGALQILFSWLEVITDTYLESCSVSSQTIFYLYASIARYIAKDWMFMFPPNLHVETLISNVMVIGTSNYLWEVIRSCQ